MAFKLYYLPMRARAEPIRMILHCGGIEYEDVTIPFQSWQDYKTGMEICPFGQLPSIQFPTGEVIAQSGSIIRYAAKLAHIYPEDPLEAARADMIYELAQDMNVINAIVNFWPTRTDAYTQNTETYFLNFPRMVTSAQMILFFGGVQPHFGDFALFHIIDNSLLVRPSCLQGHPQLRAWYERMCIIPKMAEYLEKRAPARTQGMCGSFIQDAQVNQSTV
mmetsp:Transcript_20783/g.34808  ORF Transcript_20783/g.34808 Transcript_20783/m.34808 type:complete len:219 (-) Transcript_20783:190-846(-)|eukprot:CAMPEP_0174954050 /NCGR_PEP_ID=MMETSP0004_2-20121128/209_1 /TAXON_ID=420556 /ORGANISM="Ochromonas sp., Strain CCMP1393" /LENGTH=218 /DNA_ID=CAMNT_0016201821 /DNA_START=487 /DNA_END=1143 /DNA_ORIENTATION=+